MIIKARPYSGVIESKAKERQLKVQILVDLQICGLQSRLIIPHIIVTAFVEIPIHELGSNVSQSGVCYFIERRIVFWTRRVPISLG